MRLQWGTCITVAFIACLVGSCAGGGKVRKQRVECAERLAKAIKKYEARKFGSVKNILEGITLQCDGHRIMDTAHYYLAMSLARMKMYAEAKLEFTRLTQDYPFSPFFEEAQFRIGYCVFKSSLSVDRDQTETKAAQRLFSDFLESYPSSFFADSAQKYLKMAANKLAGKEYASAKFYQKIGEKEAAVVYYKVLLSEYPASPYSAQARLNMGQMLVELGRTTEAREVLDALIAEQKTGDIAAKAKELLSRCDR